MSYLECDKKVITGLSKLVGAAQSACSLGFDDDGEISAAPPPNIDPDDIDSLVDALCVLRPDAIETSFFRALTYIIRGQWDDAIRCLYAAIRLREDMYYGKGLLAFCLCYKGDPEWRPLACEVLGKCTNAGTLRLVNALDEYVAFRDGTPRLNPSADVADATAYPVATEDVQQGEALEIHQLSSLRA